jgi:HPt (histidine-containing phosphotransfer) domain-containing protein
MNAKDRLEQKISQFHKVERPGQETGGEPSMPGACPPGEPAARPGRDETLPIVDSSVLENVTGGDAEFAREIMGFYQEALPKDVNKIQEAILAADMTGVERSGHGVKGAAANVGAMRLSRLAGRIELAAREGDMEECRKMAARLPALLEELILELKRRSA